MDGCPFLGCRCIGETANRRRRSGIQRAPGVDVVDISRSEIGDQHVRQMALQQRSGLEQRAASYAHVEQEGRDSNTAAEGRWTCAMVERKAQSPQLIRVLLWCCRGHARYWSDHLLQSHLDLSRGSILQTQRYSARERSCLEGGHKQYSQVDYLELLSAGLRLFPLAVSFKGSFKTLKLRSDTGMNP